MTNLQLEIALSLFAYLMGSIPFGYLIAKSKGIDLFKTGSGNIGATNVSRALGKTWGFAVFGLDLVKGFGPVLLARALLPGLQNEWFIIGFWSIVGHTASVFLKFKGGKGVSTMLGVALAGAPLTALSSFLAFAVVLALFQVMSVASLIGIGSSLIWCKVFHESTGALIFCSAAFVYAVIRHRKNLVRLLHREEPKFKL